MMKGIVLPGETSATDAQLSYHIVERNMLQPRSPFDIPSGPAHAALRQRLIERAQRLGHMNVTDPGLLVIIGDQDVSPEVDGRWCRFTLPYPVTEVVLASRSCVPAAQSGSADSRNLGVSVSRIRAGDHDIPLDDPSLQVGWHDPEKNWRWTAGAAHIILPEPTQNLDIEVSGTVQSGYAACRPDYNGSVNACTLSFVSGWALWDGKQAVLDVFVNNRLSGRTVCDKPGQGFRQKSLPTDAGFMFVFPQPITPSDTVSVHFSDGTGLRGSPSHPDLTAPPLTLLTKQETRKIVIVLGMHRSGTSLTSSVLSSLGVDMSDDIAVQPSNARGHWERKELVHFHDRVLRLFERDWYDSRHALDLPSTWWTQPLVRNIRDEMIIWLAARLPGVRVFGFKDPRTARMLPMWHEICAILNLEPCYVYCVRSPSQVAASLLARDGIETRDTEYRWMVYNSHAVLGVGDRPTCIISYEDWFSENGKNIVRLMSHLGVTWPFENLSLGRFLTDIADPHLRHHKEDFPEDPGRLPSDALYHHILSSLELGHFNSEALDLAAAFSTFEKFVQPMLASVSASGSPSTKASLASPVRGPNTENYSATQVGLINGLVTTLHLYTKALREVFDEFTRTVHQDRVDLRDTPASQEIRLAPPSTSSQ